MTPVQYLVLEKAATDKKNLQAKMKQANEEKFFIVYGHDDPDASDYVLKAFIPHSLIIEHIKEKENLPYVFWDVYVEEYLLANEGATTVLFYGITPYDRDVINFTDNTIKTIYTKLDQILVSKTNEYGIIYEVNL